MTQTELCQRMRVHRRRVDALAGGVYQRPATFTMRAVRVELRRLEHLGGTLWTTFAPHYAAVREAAAYVEEEQEVRGALVDFADPGTLAPHVFEGHRHLRRAVEGACAGGTDALARVAALLAGHRGTVDEAMVSSVRALAEAEASRGASFIATGERRDWGQLLRLLEAARPAA